MKRDEYNGWTNYETWLLNLWLDNDEGACRRWSCEAEGFRDDAHGLADALREEIEESIPEDMHSGFFADLINAGLAEVNWLEIAESYIGALEPVEDED